MEIVAYAEAKSRGLVRYFSGKPCKKGHIAERYTVGRACSLCRLERNRRPDSKARVVAWYEAHTHQEKLLLWAKYRHAKRWLPGDFDLTLSNVSFPEYCPALGIKLCYEAQPSKGAYDAPTVDRIDSKLGYTVNNVQIISRRANNIKNDGTPEEVMAVALFMKRTAK